MTTKPKYRANDAHAGPLPLPGKTPEPADAETVYLGAIEGKERDGQGPHWYGLAPNKEIYRFSPDNRGNAHFSGMTGSAAAGHKPLIFDKIPMDVRKKLGRVR